MAKLEKLPGPVFELVTQVAKGVSPLGHPALTSVQAWQASRSRASAFIVFKGLPFFLPILAMRSVHSNLRVPRGQSPVGSASKNFFGSRSSSFRHGQPNHVSSLILTESLKEATPRSPRILLFLTHPISSFLPLSGGTSFL